MSKEEKRRNLITSALTNFEKKGYHQTRIEDITELAGTGKGTFYLYFKSKEDLVLDVFDDLSREIEKTLQFAVDGLGAELDLMQIFKTQTYRLTTTLSEHKQSARFILKEGRSVSEKLNSKIHEFNA